jgi:hypothetical protein
MIKSIVEEIMVSKSAEFFSLGLPSLHLKECAELAETIVLLTFRDKIVNGKGQDLLRLLNTGQSLGKMAFIQNALLEIARNSMERKLVDGYKIELINRLQVNSTSAASVSKAAMPGILQSIMKTFSNANINAKDLTKMIDDSLPLSPKIS